MNENTCVCCGESIPEGGQTCWNCEHNVNKTFKTPSDKQIRLAADIANTLGIDFPMSSKDFTAATYYKFINDNIEEASSYWNDETGDGLDDEMMWFSPLNQ